MEIEEHGFDSSRSQQRLKSLYVTAVKPGSDMVQHWHWSRPAQKENWKQIKSLTPEKVPKGRVCFKHPAELLKDSQGSCLPLQSSHRLSPPLPLRTPGDAAGGSSPHSLLLPLQVFRHSTRAPRPLPFSFPLLSPTPWATQRSAEHALPQAGGRRRTRWLLHQTCCF